VLLTDFAPVVGEVSHPRFLVTGVALTASGNLHVAFFRASRSEEVNNLGVVVTSVAAATPTLFRWGLYDVDPTAGTCSLLAAVANAASAPLTNGRKSAANVLTYGGESPEKVSGRWYASAVLCVSPAAMPNVAAVQALHIDILTLPTAMRHPLNGRQAGVLTGQTDLPASFAISALSTASTSRSGPYLEMTP
jgi:hypothetical protein